MLTNLKRIASHVLLVVVIATLHVNCSKKQTATAAVTESNATTASGDNDSATSSSALQQYTGRYNINSDQISWAEITVEDNKLYGQSNDSPKAELTRESEDTYKVQGIDATVTFTRDNQQQVKGIVIKTQGYEFTGEKAK
jgi:hypothetical protein